MHALSGTEGEREREGWREERDRGDRERRERGAHKTGEREREIEREGDRERRTGACPYEAIFIFVSTLWWGD
jgi:hypothetical protein